MNADVKKAAKAYGITRLCHFTSSRNLPHIFNNNAGLLATKFLKDDEKSVFNITDNLRLDGRLEHISCSIQYPNAWYLRKAIGKETIFLDWLILFIAPAYLAHLETEFCYRNSAAATPMTGIASFEEMYAKKVTGAYGNSYTRGPNHIPSCPTDNQAEVHIFRNIMLKDILGIGVKSMDQAQREAVRLDLLQIDTDKIPFVITPDLFDPNRLSRSIQSGTPPNESLWTP